MTLRLPRDLRRPLTILLMHSSSHNHRNMRIILRHQIRIKAIGKFLSNKISGQLTSHKSRVHHQCIKKANIVIYPANIISIQRIHHKINSCFPIIAIGNQLRDHRVIMHRNLTTLIDPAIHPHAFPLGFTITREPANRRHKVTERILRIDPRLHSPAS